MKRKLLLGLVCCAFAEVNAQQYPLVHPELDESVVTSDSCLKVTFFARKQNFPGGDAMSRDVDIHSPKSVNMHPDGTRYYVNSLEGATTVVYDFKTNEKIKIIRHNFTEADSLLWGKDGNYYQFKHYKNNLNTFFGKPVESTFSHAGRYLWIPYYRRSYDINAQDPSAVAIIDTEKDEIVRLMDTGPLPKMIATSPDGQFVAISHWGNNTVALIDIKSDNPMEWKHKACLVVDKELELNFSLTKSVDRDNDSGYCLRGTVFTPDNHYLFVGCMGNDGGIAVIDLQQMKYLGRIKGMIRNMRHMVLRDGYLYLSINISGYVQRIKLETLLSYIPQLDGGELIIDGWDSCQVGKGARTIELTPDGKYIFAACNNASALYIVDVDKFDVLGSIPVDSYPVGLDISADGRFVFTTSQGRGEYGGNAVDIFELERLK